MLMEVSGCSLGDQGWIPAKGTGFLFVSLRIPSVGHSYPSHQLVLGAFLLGLRYLECEGKVKTAWSFTSTAAICLHAMKPKHENNLFAKILTEHMPLCYIHCYLSHLIQLEHFQHLPTMIEICRLCSLQPWQYRKYFLCFAWWLAAWEERVIF